MSFGHSWGSALGVLYAATISAEGGGVRRQRAVRRRPRRRDGSYAYGLAEAERRGNRRALNTLREIGPPPHTAEQLMAERTSVTRLEGGMGPRAWPNLARIALGVRESSIFDLPRIMRGFRFSLDAMWAEGFEAGPSRARAGTGDARLLLPRQQGSLGSSGRQRGLLRGAHAPSKNLVWFEQSGHEPFMDEPAKFNAAMAGLILPVLHSDPSVGAA